MRNTLMLWAKRPYIPRPSYTLPESHFNFEEHAKPAEKGSKAIDTIKKVVRVAIIGTPNAGKSTIVNHLINHRVCATSRKVHTTYTNARGVYNRNNTQVILFDTPGMVSEQQIKKHKLDNLFVTSSTKSIQQADLIAVLHDVSNSYTRNVLDATIVETLQKFEHVPSILVLNKIDQLRAKQILLDLVRKLTENTLQAQGSGKNQKQISRPIKYKTEESRGWPNFNDILMVSALNGDGLKTLMNRFMQYAKPDDWEFNNNETTDQSIKDLIINSVRARILDFMQQELPYLMEFEMEFLEVSNAKVTTSVNVICKNSRHEKLVCGAENGKLTQITELVTSDLVAIFQKGVTLTISTDSKTKPKEEKPEKNVIPGDEDILI